MSGYYTVPQGFNLVGTCGACGGPLLQNQVWTSYNTNTNPPPITCGTCGKTAKATQSTYGPILEMKP